MNLKLRTESIYIWAAVFSICFNLWINIIGIPVTLVIGPNSIDTAIVVLIYLVTIGYTLLSNFNCLPKSVGFVFIPTIIMMITNSFYPDNYLYMEKDIQAIVSALISYVVVLILMRNGLLKIALFKIGYVSFIYAIMIFFVKTGVLAIPEADVTYMEFGYYVLPAVVLLYWKYNDEGKTSDLVYSILAAVIAFIYGSRGVLFSILLFWAMYQILIKGIRSKRTLGAMLTGVVGFAIMSSKTMLTIVSIGLSSILGYSPRTLEKLLDNTILSDSGRSLMLDPALEIIKNNWFFGAGPYADRALIFFDSDDSASRGIGHYVHNIFYELAIDFGIPIAVVLVLLFIRCSVKVLNNSNENKILYLCIVSMWLFKLLISGTFWTEVWFWVWFAVLFELRREQKCNTVCATNKI